MVEAGSLECDICKSRTKRKEFSLQNERTSKVSLTTAGGMSGINTSHFLSCRQHRSRRQLRVSFRVFFFKYVRTLKSKVPYPGSCRRSIVNLFGDGWCTQPSCGSMESCLSASGPTEMPLCNALCVFALYFVRVEDMLCVLLHFCASMFAREIQQRKM